jgi:hypothetical protein
MPITAVVTFSAFLNEFIEIEMRLLRARDNPNIIDSAKARSGCRVEARVNRLGVHRF